MIKGKTGSAGNCYIVKISMRVTKSVFATLLTDKFYGSETKFPENLNKSDAQKIIESELFFHGIRGRYYNSDESLGNDNLEIYNEIFLNALNWVIKNYPYLNQN